MIHRISCLIWILAIALLAGMQYHVSYQAQALGRELHQIRATTADINENIRILEAEWAYVNNPDRLRELARKYLPLTPLKGRQIARFSDIPFPPAVMASLARPKEGI